MAHIGVTAVIVAASVLVFAAVRNMRLADRARDHLGSVSTTVSTTSNCFSLLNSHPVGFTIGWNTGQTSTVRGNASATEAAAVLAVIVIGIVTGGLFAGDAVVLTLVGPATSILLCTLGLGTVSNVYAVMALTID